MNTRTESAQSINVPYCVSNFDQLLTFLENGKKTSSLTHIPLEKGGGKH